MLAVRWASFRFFVAAWPRRWPTDKMLFVQVERSVTPPLFDAAAPGVCLGFSPGSVWRVRLWWGAPDRNRSCRALADLKIPSLLHCFGAPVPQERLRHRGDWFVRVIWKPEFLSEILPRVRIYR